MRDLLMLHGAMGSSVQLEPLAEKLKNEFRVYLLNFSGHGGKPVPEEPFSIEMFTNDVLNFIDKNRLQGIDVYGYSMGGYVALHLAEIFKNKIGRIFTTATKFDWNEESSVKESKMLDPEKIIEKIPKFADQLAKRHAPENWKSVLMKTAEMMTALGKNKLLKEDNFKKIENEVQLSVGDSDNIVSIEETTNAYRNLPDGKLLVLPGTPHPIEKIPVDRLAAEIDLFFK